MKDANPMRLTDMYIQSPCKFIMGGFLILSLCAGLSFSLGFFELSDQLNRDFLILTDERVIAYDKMSVAEEYLLSGAGNKKDVAIRTTSFDEWNPCLLYQNKEDGDLLDKDNLLKIQEIENHVKGIENWENLCYAESENDSKCNEQISFVTPLAFLKYGGA